MSGETSGSGSELVWTDVLASFSLLALVFASAKAARGVLIQLSPGIYFYVKEVLFLTTLLAMLTELIPVLDFFGVFGFPVMVCAFLGMMSLGMMEDHATGNPAIPLVEMFLAKPGATPIQRLLTVVVQVATAHAVPCVLGVLHSLPPFSLSHLGDMSTGDLKPNPITVTPLQGACVEGLGAAIFQLLIETILVLEFIPMVLRIVMLASVFPILGATLGPYTGLAMNPAVAHANFWHVSGVSMPVFVLVYWVGPFVFLLGYTIIADSIRSRREKTD